MPLKLNSTGGGSVTLDVGSTASNYTVTLPATSGTLMPIASVTNNGVVYVNSSGSVTSGSGLVFDGSNLGLGVTPSAWRTSGDKALQIGSWMSLFSDSGVTSTVGSNVYINSSNQFVYQSNGYSTKFQQYQGQHVWFTAPSGTAGNAISFTQAMTLDASGNLGIGTSSPAVISGFKTLTLDGSTGGLLTLYSNGVRNSTFYTDGTQSVIGTNNNTPLTFLTNGAERMRIDSSGNLLVGTTSTVGSAVNTVQIVSGSNAQIRIRNANTASGKNWGIGPDGTNSFVVYNQNNTGAYIADGATAWSANSDERLKTNLVPIEDAANKVSTLRAVTGRFKTDDENFSRSFLIAQDVQAVLPEAVDVRDDEQGTLGIRYTDVIPLLVAAVKELKAELDELKAKVNA